MSPNAAVPELHPLTVDLDTYRERMSPATDGLGSPLAAARTLARALAASPCARRLADGVLVVREGPSPRLGILARVDEADRAWLAVALAALQGTVSRLRRVDWPEVEAAAESVAEELLQRVGRERLEAAAVRGVPRGGLVAAGLVAYALDLPAGALDREPGDGRLTLLVDDCALSGARFRERLAAHGGGQVVFAPLFSPPALREAIEAAEPDVAACVSGRDLEDHAPRRLGPDYEAWAGAWRRRSGDRVYWVGQPDHVVFPWSEPEESVWDGSRGEEVPAFSVAPPELCLARRGADASGPEIQVQPRSPGPLRPAPHLLWGALDGYVVIRDPAADRALTLDGTAAAMWRALVREGDVEGAARRLADVYDAPGDRIRGDLDDLARRLVDRGALVTGEPTDRDAGPARAAPAGGASP